MLVLLTACWVPEMSLTFSGGRTLLSILNVLKLFMKLLKFYEKCANTTPMANCVQNPSLES